MIDITRSIKACAEYYGEDSSAMESYLVEGEKKALELNNRGPIKFDSNGSLCSDIRKAYSDNGFYIFENVIIRKPGFTCALVHHASALRGMTSEPLM